MRSLRTALLALAAIAPVALAPSIAGCLLEGFTNAPAAEDAGADAAPDTGAPACGVTYPSPPESATPGGAHEFVAAIRSVNLGDNGAVGLDLDHHCSCHGDGPSCKEPKQHCDDAEGRDNAAGGLFGLLKLGLGAGNFGSDYFSSEANAGRWSLLFRVSGYNGEADDEQVELDWYITGSFGGTPTWDGTDAWRISDLCLEGGDITKPLYVDPNAYVTNNVLVASLPDASIRFAGMVDSVSFRLVAAGLVATVTPVPPDGFTLRDGQIVGRWTLKDVFATVASFRSNQGKPICIEDSNYSVAKGYICNAPDILSTEGAPSKPCDALSFAIGFQADPAMLGPVFSPPPLSPGCTPDAGDPANDSCL